MIEIYDNQNFSCTFSCMLLCLRYFGMVSVVTVITWFIAAVSAVKNIATMGGGVATVGSKIGRYGGSVSSNSLGPNTLRFTRKSFRGLDKNGNKLDAGDYALQMPPSKMKGKKITKLQPKDGLSLMSTASDIAATVVTLDQLTKYGEKTIPPEELNPILSQIVSGNKYCKSEIARQQFYIDSQSNVIENQQQQINELNATLNKFSMTSRKEKEKPISYVTVLH